jgi:hypothetical protein
MAEPEESSIFRTEGLTAAERDELIRARAWFNLNAPPTLTPGEAAGLTPQQVAERNALLRIRWLEHRGGLGMSPMPPYQASDSAIVGVLVLPDGSRVRIQSRYDPGPDVRNLLGSQTTLRQLDNGQVVSTTSTFWTPRGPGSGVTGNLVHIEPWSAVVMNRLDAPNAVLLLELPLCELCNFRPRYPDLPDNGVPNFSRMLPPNSRVTVVNPEYAETYISLHGPRGPGYDLRRIVYEARFRPPAGPRPSTEAVQQAIYRSRMRARSGGFIDLGALFSVGKSPESFLAPGRLASMRRAMPHVGGAAAGVAGGLVQAWILASLNERAMRKEFESKREAMNHDVLRQTDQIMALLASGQRAYANVEMVESNMTTANPTPQPGQLNWIQSPSAFEYVGTSISSQSHEGDHSDREYGYGWSREKVRHTMAFELKVHPDVVAAYRELAEAIKWADVAVEDPYLDRDEVLFLSLGKQELEKMGQELFGRAADAVGKELEKIPAPPFHPAPAPAVKPRSPLPPKPPPRAADGPPAPAQLEKEYNAAPGISTAEKKSFPARLPPPPGEIGPDH